MLSPFYVPKIIKYNPAASPENLLRRNEVHLRLRRSLLGPTEARSIAENGGLTASSPTGQGSHFKCHSGHHQVRLKVAILLLPVFHNTCM